MPRFRKLNAAEPAARQPMLSARAQVAQVYDALLADFALGDYGRGELIAGERRNAVRSRLHATARRRGLVLRFRPGPGLLTFRVETAPAVASPTPPQEPVRAARVAAQRDEVASAMVRPHDRPGRPADARRPPSDITRCCPAGCARGSHQAGAGTASGGKGGRQRPA